VGKAKQKIGIFKGVASWDNKLTILIGQGLKRLCRLTYNLYFIAEKQKFSTVLRFNYLFMRGFTKHF